MAWPIFKDVKFFIIKCEDNSLIEQLKLSGAVQHPLLSESVRFAISDDPSPMEVGEADDLYAVPVVTAKWIRFSGDSGQFLPFKPFHPGFKPLFANYTFAMTGLSLSDRLSLWSHLTIYGAKVQHQLDRSVTHVILGRASGVFYDACKTELNDAKPILVTPDWIVDCVSQMSIVPHATYHPDLLRRPTPAIPITKASVTTAQTARPLQPLAPSDDGKTTATPIQPRPLAPVHSVAQHSGPFSPNRTGPVNTPVIHVVHTAAPSSSLTTLPATNLQAATGITVQQICMRSAEQQQQQQQLLLQQQHQQQQQQQLPHPSDPTGRGRLDHLLGAHRGGPRRGVSQFEQRFPHPPYQLQQPSQLQQQQQQQTQRYNLSCPLRFVAQPMNTPQQFSHARPPTAIPTQRPPSVPDQAPAGGPVVIPGTNLHTISEGLLTTMPHVQPPTTPKAVIPTTCASVVSTLPSSSSQGAGHHTRVGKSKSNKHTQEQNLNEEEKEAIVYQYVQNILSSQNKCARETLPGRSCGSSSASEAGSSGGNSLAGSAGGQQSLQQVIGLNNQNTQSLLSTMPSSGANASGPTTPRKARSPKSPGRGNLNTLTSNTNNSKALPKSPRGGIKLGGSGLTKVLSSPQQQQQPQHHHHQQPTSIMMAGPNVSSVLLTGSLQNLPPGTPLQQPQQQTQQQQQLQKSSSLQQFIATGGLSVQQHQHQAQQIHPHQQQHMVSGAPTYIVQRHPVGSQLLASGVGRQVAQTQLQAQLLCNQGQYQSGSEVLNTLSNQIPNVALTGQSCATASVPVQQMSSAAQHQFTTGQQPPTALLVRTNKLPNQVPRTAPGGGMILRPHQAGSINPPAGFLHHQSPQLIPSVSQPTMHFAGGHQATHSNITGHNLVQPSSTIPMQQPHSFQAPPFAPHQQHHPDAGPPYQVTPQAPIRPQQHPTTAVRHPLQPNTPSQLPVAQSANLRPAITTHAQRHAPSGGQSITGKSPTPTSSAQSTSSSIPPVYYGHEGSPKPGRLEECLVGCVFLLLGYRNVTETQRALWRRIIRSHGAEVVLVYDPIRVTHVIIDCQLEEPDIIKQALKDRMRIVTIFWVNDILADRRMVPPSEILHLPSPFSSDITFSFIKSQIVSLTGFEGKERLRVEFLIKQLGASFTDYLEASNTLLICKRPEGKKYETAQLWSIPCVNVRWLQDIYLGDLMALSLDLPHKYLSFEPPDVTTALDRCTPRAQDLLIGWQSPIRLNHDVWTRLGKLSAEFAREERDRKRKLELELNNQVKMKRFKCVLPPLSESDLQIAAQCRTRSECLTEEYEQIIDLHCAFHEQLKNVNVSEDICFANVPEINELIAFGKAKHARIETMETLPFQSPISTTTEQAELLKTVKFEDGSAGSTVGDVSLQPIPKILETALIVQPTPIHVAHCDGAPPSTRVLKPDQIETSQSHEVVPSESNKSDVEIQLMNVSAPHPPPEDEPNKCEAVFKIEDQTNPAPTESVGEITLINSSCPISQPSTSRYEPYQHALSHITEVDNRKRPHDDESSPPVPKRSAIETDVAPVCSTSSTVELVSNLPVHSSFVVNSGENKSTHASSTILTETMTLSSTNQPVYTPLSKSVDLHRLKPMINHPLISRTVRITFTAIDHESRLSLTELCSQLPDCFVVDSAEQATHVVCTKLLRTPKTYQAVALGRYLVTPKWVQASVEKGMWLDEKPWIVNDPDAEDQLGVRLTESIARSRRRSLLGPQASLFSGLEFWLSPGTRHREICSILIKASGGVVRHKRPTQKMALLLPPKQIIICHEDDSHVANYLMRIKSGNKAVHHEEFVLSGILRQEIDYESYQIKYVSTLQTGLKTVVAAAEAALSISASSPALTTPSVMTIFSSDPNTVPPPSKRPSKSDVDRSRAPDINALSSSHPTVLPHSAISSQSVHNLPNRTDTKIPTTLNIPQSHYPISHAVQQIVETKPTPRPQSGLQRLLTESSVSLPNEYFCQTREAPISPGLTRQVTTYRNPTTVTTSITFDSAPQNVSTARFLPDFTHTGGIPTTSGVQSPIISTKSRDSPFPHSVIGPTTHCVPQRPVTALTAMIVAAETGSVELPSIMTSDLTADNVPMSPFILQKPCNKSNFRSVTHTVNSNLVGSGGGLNARSAAADAHAVATATAALSDRKASSLLNTDTVSVASSSVNLAISQATSSTTRLFIPEVYGTGSAPCIPSVGLSSQSISTPQDTSYNPICTQQIARAVDPVQHTAVNALSSACSIATASITEMLQSEDISDLTVPPTFRLNPPISDPPEQSKSAHSISSLVSKLFQEPISSHSSEICQSDVDVPPTSSVSNEVERATISAPTLPIDQHHINVSDAPSHNTQEFSRNPEIIDLNQVTPQAESQADSPKPLT